MPYEPYLNGMRQLIGKCESPILQFQKFPVFNNGEGNDSNDFDSQNVHDFVERVKSCKDERKFISPVSLPVLPGMKSFLAKNGGRLLVNHSGSVVENSGLALHHTFGYPIIPGSALKGIAADVAREENKGDDEKYRQYLRVFGNTKENRDEDKSHPNVKNQDQAGSVIFYMAIPTDNSWNIKEDVLTAHDRSGVKNPVPVFFPAVEKGITFRFSIAPRQANSEFAETDVQFAVKYLKRALEENGVGAKTTAGYGWFYDFKDEEDKK